MVPWYDAEYTFPTARLYKSSAQAEGLFYPRDGESYSVKNSV